MLKKFSGETYRSGYHFKGQKIFGGHKRLVKKYKTQILQILRDLCVLRPHLATTFRTRTFTSCYFAHLEVILLRWPIRVIHAQKVKSPHTNTKHANKSAIHATISRIHTTISRFTPQFHHSRHNFTIHATISRFTPQFHDSRHNFTIHATISRIHATKKPLTDHGLNTH